VIPPLPTCAQFIDCALSCAQFIWVLGSLTLTRVKYRLQSESLKKLTALTNANSARELGMPGVLTCPSARPCSFWPLRVFWD
jgi:hypothetical protein